MMTLATLRVPVAIVVLCTVSKSASSFGHNLVCSATAATATQRPSHQSSADYINHSIEERGEHDVAGYPVQVHHQGHSATIFVRKNEPILQALERQSTFSNGNSHSAKNQYEEETVENINREVMKGEETTTFTSSLALSHIPHECRRGNCLTCSSRVISKTTNSNSANDNAHNTNILASIDNGLSPTMASSLTKSGYILTCCSYVTGPGVVLELDQNDKVWDIMYRKRICDDDIDDTKQMVLEAQARLLRKVDEENLDKWKRKIEEKVAGK